MLKFPFAFKQLQDKDHFSYSAIKFFNLFTNQQSCWLIYFFHLEKELPSWMADISNELTIQISRPVLLQSNLFVVFVGTLNLQNKIFLNCFRKTSANEFFTFSNSKFAFLKFLIQFFNTLQLSLCFCVYFCLQI